MQDTPQRILIFNVNWLGDVLFSTAAIRNIRYNFPDSFMACIVPAACAQLLEGNPHLDEVIIFDERLTHRGLGKKLNFIKTLRGKKFDTVFLFHRSLTRALICRLAGIREVIGYATKKRAFLLSHKIPLLSLEAQHRIDYYLNIPKQAGLKVKDRQLDFFIGPQEKILAEEFLKGQGVKDGELLIGINAGGNWPLKRWPQESWAALADSLIEQLGAKVIITGGQKDIALAQEIQGLMKHGVTIAAGKLNLKGFAALCLKLDLFISADTGPLHVANAVGAKKIIALFGPTSLLVTGPYPSERAQVIQKDTGCKIPCYALECPDNRCMKAITVEDIMERAKMIIRP